MFIIFLYYTRKNWGIAMKQLPQISEAEYEIMKLIWREAPISTNQVTDYLTQGTQWSPKTIQTLLKRLTQKGVLSYTKEGRMFVYTYLIQESEYLKQENTHFLNRFYNGNISSMLTNFIKSDQISKTELEDLKTLLLGDEKNES